MPLIAQSIKKRVDNVEENRKEQHSIKSLAVSDLVSLIHEKRAATEAGDTERVDKLNDDYPILRAMDFDSDSEKAEERLRKHFEKHPIKNERSG